MMVVAARGEVAQFVGIFKKCVEATPRRGRKNAMPADDRTWSGLGSSRRRGCETVTEAQPGMFGYPVPTHDEQEFTNQAAREIYIHSYSEQVVEAFRLVCARRSLGALGGSS